MLSRRRKPSGGYRGIACLLIAVPLFLAVSSAQATDIPGQAAETAAPASPWVEWHPPTGPCADFVRRNMPGAMLGTGFIRGLTAVQDISYCKEAMPIPSDQKEFLELNILSCGLPRYQLGLDTYGRACIPEHTFDRFSTENQLIRHAELVELFDRELEDMQRLNPENAAYAERWDDFERRWKALIQNDPGGKIDDSRLLRASVQKGLANRVNAIGRLRQVTQEAHQQMDQLMNLPAGMPSNTFHLMKAAIFLKTLNSKDASREAEASAKRKNDAQHAALEAKKKKWIAEGRDPAFLSAAAHAFTAEEELQARRNFLYRKYPELLSNPELLDEAYDIVSSRVDLRQVAKQTFGNDAAIGKMVQQKKEYLQSTPEGTAFLDANGEDVLRQDSQMQIVGQTITDAISKADPNAPSDPVRRNSPTRGQVLSTKVMLLERDFLGAMKQVRKNRDQELRNLNEHPENLIRNTSVVLSAAASISPITGSTALQNITTHYCATSKADTKHQDLVDGVVSVGETVAGWSGLAGGAAMLGMIGATVLGAPVVAGGMLVFMVGSFAVSATTGLPTSVYEISTGIDHYHDTKSKFYSNLAQLNEVDAAHSRMITSGAMNTLNIAAVGVPVLRTVAFEAKAVGALATVSKTGQMGTVAERAVAGTEAVRSVEPLSQGLRVRQGISSGLKVAEVGTMTALTGASAYYAVTQNTWQGWVGLGMQLAAPLAPSVQRRFAPAVPGP